MATILLHAAFLFCLSVLHPWGCDSWIRVWYGSVPRVPLSDAMTELRQHHLKYSYVLTRIACSEFVVPRRESGEVV